MDPLTQGALGAAASLALLNPRLVLKKSPLGFAPIAWMGALSGMAPDLDVLIRSSTDPLLAIEYHRHFTHSWAFVPVGGSLAALPFLLRKSWRKHWRWVFAATLAGYATHAALDACTTYGTLLFWPFSDQRVSLSWISVIDPLYTLPLLAAVILAVKRKRAALALAGFSWSLLYLGAGAIQQERARSAQRQLAAQRGTEITRSALLPSFLNNVTWRSLYQSGDRYHVDKVRVPWFGPACVTPGVRVPTVGAATATQPKTARAHRLIRWFANDWVTWDPHDATVLGDLRYGFSPTEATPIWGLRTHNDTDTVEWVNNRSKRAITWHTFSELLFENGPDAICFD